VGILNFGGFECGNGDEVRTVTGPATYSTSVVRSGTYSYKCAPVGTGTANVRIGGLGADGRAIGDFNVPTLYSRVYAEVETGLASGSEEVLVVLDTAGANKGHVRLDSNGKFSVYDTVGLVATGTTTYPSGFYRLELMTTTGASTSAYELRINGTTELSGTGTFGNVNHGTVRFGKGTNRSGQGYVIYFDDYQFRDDMWPGDSQVKVLLPDGNGSVTQWTAGTNSSNYLEVDELPADDGTTYLQKSASGDQTHYVTFENCSAKSISGTINAVKLFTKSAESGSITSATRARMNSGGTAVEGSSFNGSTTWVAQMLLRETDPATSAAWLTSGIDALEGGVRDTAASGNVRCSSVLLMVDYTPSSTQTITTNAPSSGSQVFQPSVSATAAIVAAAPAAGSQVFQPTVSATASIATNAPASSAQVFEPTVTATATISTAAPTSGAQVFEPSVSATASVVGAAPTSGAQVFEPSVTNVATIATASPVAASQVFQPSLSTSVEIVGGAPAPSSQVFTPSVEASNAVVVPLLPSTAEVFEPTVSPGVVTIAASFLASTSVVFEPTVSGGTTFPGISLDWTPGYPSEPELHYSPRGRPLHWSGGNRLHWSPRKGMDRAPQIHSKKVSAGRNGAISFDDYLEPDELLTGTPTVTASPSGLTISNARVSEDELTINERAVAAGRAVQFRVSGGTAGTRYVITATCGTTSDPAQTLPLEAVLDVN
jgi:hypothetical protein